MRHVVHFGAAKTDFKRLMPAQKISLFNISCYYCSEIRFTKEMKQLFRYGSSRNAVSVRYLLLTLGLADAMKRTVNGRTEVRTELQFSSDFSSRIDVSTFSLPSVHTISQLIVLKLNFQKFHENMSAIFTYSYLIPNCMIISFAD